jgi:DamX protein
MSTLHAEEAFLDHYQFSHDPFAPRVPGFKFFPAQRKPVLGQLHHLARYSQLLLVVTGPLGSGKSLLRQALVASTNKQVVHSVVVSARGAGDADGVLRQVAQGMESSRPEVRDLLDHVNQRALSGQETYILVDDAEQLEGSALEALYGLAAGTEESRAHVFLFGEPSIVSRLDALSGGQERHHVIELQPYELTETSEYLAQRLEGAGAGLDVFSEEQVADIHQQSRGWPGVINQVARDTLIDAMLAERGSDKVTGLPFRMPKKHVVAAGVVVLAIAAAWLMRSGPSETSAPETAATPSTNEGEAAPNAPSNGNGQSLQLPLNAESEPVVRQPLAEAAGPEERDNGIGEMLAPPTGGMPSAQRPPVVDTSAPSSRAAETQAPRPAAPPSQPATPTEKPAAAEQQAAPRQAPAQAANAPKPAEQSAPKSAAAGSGSAAWYQGVAGSRYTLQILGTRSEDSARAFVAQNGADYRYFRKMLDGKPFYVVTYGSFADRDAAQAALKALPAKVQSGKPWPKTFSSIQQEIAQAR